MSKKKNRRPQAVKVRNEEWMRARLDHARSATQPRPAGNQYRRQNKHKGRQFDE